MDISILYKIPTTDVLWESVEEDSDTPEENTPSETETTIDNIVEHVYIMNRIDDIKHWSAVMQSVKNSNVGLKYYSRYPKLDHTNTKYLAEWKSGGNYKSIQEYVLSKTLIGILKDAKTKGYKQILILNDTARFHSNTKLLFKTQYDSITRVNPDWKVIYLSARQENYNVVSDKNFYYPNMNTRCDYAFMIVENVYDNTIKGLKKGLTLDQIFNGYINSKSIFVVYPNVILNDNNIAQYSRDIEGYTIVPRPKNTPLISVIMTAHNSERYIRYSIESILNQTYTNLELIIIDDASTDRTGKIIEEYEARDSRITYLHNKTNYGTYVSKNIGIKHSKGQYITFQDSDDYSIRNRLELQLNTLLTSKFLVCFGKYVNKELKLQFCEITLFMRRDCVDFIGYFDSVRFGADSEYRRRLELLKIPITVIDKYIYSRLDRLMEGNNLGNPNSLTNHKRTGLNSKARMIYRKSFECFHSLIRTRRGMQTKRYYITFPLERRPFEILLGDNYDRSEITVQLSEGDKYIYKVKL